jgi:hypothetical protein
MLKSVDTIIAKKIGYTQSQWTGRDLNPRNGHRQSRQHFSLANDRRAFINISAKVLRAFEDDSFLNKSSHHTCNRIPDSLVSSYHMRHM